MGSVLKKIIIYLFLPFFLQANSFVLFTEPKTGTHLLIPILTELTGKRVYWAKEYVKNAKREKIGEWSDDNDRQWIFFACDQSPWEKTMMDLVWEKNKRQGTFLHLHAPYTKAMENYLKEKGCINFFLKRDPRDRMISLLNHYKNIDCDDEEVKQIQSDDERLLYLIQTKLREETHAFMGWIHSSHCCVLDFRKLMGAHGGAASDADALEEMKKIRAALQIGLSDKQLMQIYKKHFGTGWNFFKGKVGTWREYFTELHKAAAKEAIGDLLIELGYERDENW